MKNKILILLIMFFLILFLYSLEFVYADSNVLQNTNNINEIKIERTAKYNGNIIIELKSTLPINNINQEGWLLSEDKLKLTKEFDETSRGISELVTVTNSNGISSELHIKIPTNIIFISDDGNDENDGKTSETPIKTISKAYQNIGTEDGMIIFSGDLRIDNQEDGNFYYSKGNTKIKNKGTIISSVYIGSDGEEKISSIINCSKATYGFNIYLNSDTIFENVNFKAESLYNYAICGQGNNVTFEETVTCSDDKAVIYGGYLLNPGQQIKEVSCYNYTLTINGGKWWIVEGANRRTDTPRAMGKIGDVTLIINGGEFSNIVAIGGYSEQDGDLTLKINGGIFKNNIYGIARGGNNESATLGAKRGNVNIEITSGTFYGQYIKAMEDETETPIVGNYTLKIKEGVTFANKDLKIESKNVDGICTAIVPDELIDCLDENFGKNIYVKFDGDDLNDGLTFKTPVKTLAVAFQKIKQYGGNVIICGEVEIQDNIFEECAKQVNITGEWNDNNYNGNLVLKNDIIFNNKINISNLTLTAELETVINMNGNDLSVLNGVNCIRRYFSLWWQRSKYN